MTYAKETESLLKPRQTTWRHRKTVIVGIVIAFVTLVVLLCAISGLIYGYIFWKTDNNNNNVAQLKNVLPNSFDVLFKIQTENSFDSMKTNDITVRWETESNIIRYQQESEDTTWNERISTTVTILDQRAVVSLRQENQTSWVCAGDLKSFDWFSILRLMMISVESNKTEENCSGRIWTVPYEGQIVSICFTGFQIAYIRYDNKVAKTQEWMVPSRSSIKLPHDAPTCEVKYPQVPSRSKLEHEYQQSASDLIRNQLDNRQNLREGYAPSGLSDMFARSTKLDCLFVHGIGEETPTTGFKNLTSMAYWGHIENNTPQCSSHQFIQFNTVDNGWDSTVLHQMFCEYATGSKFGGRISNKIIFSHSMGNNIIAAALHNKTCTLDKLSSKWYSVSAPWRGSKVVDKLQTLCSGHGGPKYLHIIPNIVADILRHTKFCTADGKMGHCVELHHMALV